MAFITGFTLSLYLLTFPIHSIAFDPNIEDTITQAGMESTGKCNLNDASNNWILIDEPSFTFSQNRNLFTPVSINSSPTPRTFLEFVDGAQTPFLTYPLSLFVSKGPESTQGQGGKIFVSGAAIYSTGSGNLLTAPLRNSRNFGAAWNTSTFTCANFPTQNNCQNGNYVSETGSLGIRVIDGRNNRNLVFHEDNIFREVGNSGAEMEKIADLNTIFSAQLGSSRILVTDAFYSRDLNGTEILATAVVQVGGGYKSILISSNNNGQAWQLRSTLEMPGKNLWITSLAVDLKYGSASTSNPLIVVGGYTNTGSGDSTWYIAKKYLNDTNWTIVENTLTRGRFSTVNRMLISPDSRLVVAGQLLPSASNSNREGYLRRYNLSNSTFTNAHILSNGQFYDVGLANEETLVASGTANSQPQALKSTNDGAAWTTFANTIENFSSGWAYEIAADHQGNLYWILQDGSGWKTYKLNCR